MKFFRFLIVVPGLIFGGGPDSGTILLYNDSPAILTAVIQASNGEYLGQATIQPNEQQNFTTNLSPTQYETPGNPQVSLTPYVVIWQCPSKRVYSMCTQVSPGSMIRANSCPGDRFCEPKEGKKKSDVNHSDQ